MERTFGVVTGKVIDVQDPDGMGRVKVHYPWLPGKADGYWAPIATLMSGGKRGSWFMPQLEDDVLVAFEQGDMQNPFIVGFLWNGVDQPPETDPQVRALHSVNGHRISLYDPDPSEGDQGFIQIADAHGNRIELANGLISITSNSAITIDAPTVSIRGRQVLTASADI